jgi:hypothetical protein
MCKVKVRDKSSNEVGWAVAEAEAEAEKIKPSMGRFEARWSREYR